MKIKSPAKINLALDILGRDPSGYHLIRTIFHEISLHDIIEIKEIPRGIKIECSDPGVPTGRTNTVYKAVKLLNPKKGIRIKITKNIPVQSGLGGASSNAAAVLKALNRLWHLGLTKPQLAELGAKIGMDVPFFIYGGTALGTHFGEKITPLPRIRGLKIKLKPRPAGVSTREAYSKISLTHCGKNTQKTEKILAAIKAGNLKEIIKNIHNDFQAHPGPPYLTGSGSAEFTISHK